MTRPTRSESPAPTSTPAAIATIVSSAFRKSPRPAAALSADDLGDALQPERARHEQPERRQEGHRHRRSAPPCLDGVRHRQHHGARRRSSRPATPAPSPAAACVRVRDVQHEQQPQEGAHRARRSRGSVRTRRRARPPTAPTPPAARMPRSPPEGPPRSRPSRCRRSAAGAVAARRPGARSPRSSTRPASSIVAMVRAAPGSRVTSAGITMSSADVSSQRAEISKAAQVTAKAVSTGRIRDTT